MCRVTTAGSCPKGLQCCIVAGVPSRTEDAGRAAGLMPTYVDLAGIAASTWDYGPLEGTSMVPLLQEAGASGREQVF